jgi:hypothetical protein
LAILKTRPGGSGSEQVAANSEEDEGSSNPADDQPEEDGSLGGSSIDAGNGKGKFAGGGLRGAMPSRLATPRAQFGAEVDDRTETASPNLPKFLPPRKLVQVGHKFNINKNILLRSRKFAKAQPDSHF